MSNLKTQVEISKEAGCSKNIVSRAVKTGRLRYEEGTKKINITDPLTTKFIAEVKENKVNQSTVNGGSTEIILPDTGTPLSPDLEESEKNRLDAATKYAKEKAELTKQNRIKVELSNAVRRGELIESDSVEQSVMMFLDRWFNTNKRKFNSYWDELVREVQSESKPLLEIKRDFLNLLEGAADEAKNSTVDKLEEIKEVQAKG